MIRKESKIFIILFSVISLAIIGYVGWVEIQKSDPDYTVKELLKKYPLIIDLKMAVNNGELNYDRLPDAAKEALDKYDSIKKSNDDTIIKELTP